MKNLGRIQDPKDVITKEYADKQMLTDTAHTELATNDKTIAGAINELEESKLESGDLGEFGTSEVQKLWSQYFTGSNGTGNNQSNQGG